MVRAGAGALLLVACVEVAALPPCEGDGDCGSTQRCEASACVEMPVTSACGFAYARDDACANCLAGSCCEEATACAGESSCAETHACYATCSARARGEAASRDCRAECDLLASGLADGAETAALQVCLSRSCADACTSGCGFTQDFQGAECEACVSAADPACSLRRACAEDPDCQRALTCIGSCRTPRCITECHASSPGTRATVAELRRSLAGGCDVACGKGRDWACVEDHERGPRSAEEVELVFRPVDSIGNEKLAAVRIRACGFADVECGAPLAEATSDADGVARMTLRIGRDGFRGYFRADREDYVANLYDPGHDVRTPDDFLVGMTPSSILASLQFITADLPAVEPGTASLSVLVLDCRLGEAPDVTVSVDTGGGSIRTWYYRDGLPNAGAAATDGSGSALALNIPIPAGAPGVRYPVEVRAGDRLLGRRDTLFVPDALSIQLIGPLPGAADDGATP